MEKPMIKALCCYNTIPDFALLSEPEWVSGSKAGFVDTSYLKSKMNCFDESALELTLRFIEQLKKVSLMCRASALTIGCADRSVQKSLAADGFNDVYNISFPDKDLSTSSETISKIIYRFIKSCGGFDLIILGMESEVSNQSKIPFLLAEMLGTDCISQVSSFEAQDESVLVKYMQDDYKCSEVITYPVLLAVGNSPGTALRIPTLKRRLSVSPDALHFINYQNFISDQEIADTDAFCSLSRITPNIFYRKGCILQEDDKMLCAEKMLADIMEIQNK